MTTRILMFVLAMAAMTATRANADPPERVGRIAFLGGAASFRTAAATDWTPAVINYPVTVGDHLWTDRAGRLELEMGATSADLDSMTALSVLNLDHHVVQLRLAEGSTIARVHELAPDESLEIDTPNAAITLLRPGVYRIDVPATGDLTTVTVRRGDADVAAGPEAFPLHVGESATIAGFDSPTHTITAGMPLNEFDDWAMFRDRRVENTMTLRYVPRTVVGYEDLDEFGTWRVVAGYGPVWVPNVRAEWAPYRFGHWAWVEPWGWTWVDDAPWGFAPFHYGRWAYVAGGWVWVPGEMRARPIYAPALVAFVGGSNWRIGVSVNQPVGWFPLGPREVFVPAYVSSPAYVEAINRPHVTVTNINVNVTNVTYVNRTAPGGMTVVSRETFVRAQPVATAAVRVTPQAASTAVVVGHAAPSEIAPVAVARHAVVAAPPASVASRAVVVRTPPAASIAASVPVRVTVAAPAERPSRPSRAESAAPQVPERRPTDRQTADAMPPNRAAADLAARHAKERADMEQRHAAERADLQRRQAEELRRSTDSKAQSEIRARQARESAELDVRQKREHDQLQKRQESERRDRE